MGSQEGLPSRLPISALWLAPAGKAGKRELGLLYYLKLLKMEKTVVLFRREKIQNRLP